MSAAPTLERSTAAIEDPQPQASAPRLEARSLSVSFDAVGRAFEAAPVLRDISFDVTPGEVVAILGASGCGKSTLLRAVGGLDTGNSGQIRIGGNPVTAYDPRTAVGFQEPRLLPWRSVRKNIELGLPRELSRAAGAARVDELLELVGLADRAELRPREISGGMAQRTSLARALARRPGVLLLDEPFGALDALTRLKMQDLLLEVHAQTGTTVLLVTHDVDEALQLADRILLLGAEDSSTQAGATVKQLLTIPGRRPRDRGSAELVRLRSQLYAGLGVDSH
ncbi:ABC transporter ATP-binding protein [Garicola koreensis]|uniref:Sulfonate transport system ATP-binding protein n=1 Tax=Garicola koreensis TaxID=1262554 RepID=A0A7W5XPL2_9MICC|nr:ABC transporter ATP-binding protein [Garicola koreensis]MBB3668077.1 sulfonate transport system ATP-binding protein [Garicola koreensis]